MKSTHAWLKIALLALCLAPIPSFGAEPADDSAAQKIPPERFEAMVLKVFSASDGDAVFRAYLVLWKDQEVIVSDPLAKTNYKTGDVIQVLATNLPFLKGQEPYRLLHFQAVPQRPGQKSD